MDFKKFGLFVLLLGMIIFAVGGVTMAANQPKKFDTAESQTNMLGMRDDLSNYFHTKEENIIRASRRNNSGKIMAAGGIVAFLGAGMVVSAKKKTVV